MPDGKNKGIGAVLSGLLGDRIPLWVRLAYTAFVCVAVPNYWVDYGLATFLFYCDTALLMGLAAVWTDRLWGAFADGRIPLWVKFAYTAFVCVLVRHYWRDYGPTNFLYYCDVALLMALVAVWTEQSIWASMPAVGILMPQALWMLDFLCGAVGLPLTGMTAYMFDGNIPLFTRGLSFFHFWLPIFLVWLLVRLGYDRRALVGWTLLAWVLMLVCYFWMPAPPPPADNPKLPVNINYVWGMSDERPQDWMPANAYFCLLLGFMPTCFFLPTHGLLRWVMRPCGEPERRGAKEIVAPMANAP